VQINPRRPTYRPRVMDYNLYLTRDAETVTNENLLRIRFELGNTIFLRVNVI
jgi:hypothetical protein